MGPSDQILLDTLFLDLAHAASATVGRIIRHDTMVGNGFMISDRLFLTNNHVIHDFEDAVKSIVEFNYELDYERCPKPTTKFALAPHEFLMGSPETDLDYTIIAIGQRLAGKNDLSDFGYCPIKENDGNYSLGEFVNIVQHPGPEFKKIVLRNSHLVAQSEDVVHYYATVISGSSGSPVFNDAFEPIALHHYGCPSRSAFTKEGKPGPKQIAEGIRISAILRKIKSDKNKLNEKQRVLVETALNSTFSSPSLLYRGKLKSR